MSDAPTPAVRLRRSREQTIESLCRHFASDNLTMEELERRIDVAHRVDSLAELDALLADLPEPAAAEAGESAGDTSAASVSSPSASAPGPPPIARPERGYAIAIMGGSARKGRWVPAQRTFVYATWGGVELDFRDAVLPPGVTEILAIVIMGGIEIIVPPGLAVESEGIAIMGGFDQSDHAADRRTPNAPVLRIRGIALMGGVDVKVRLSGETQRDAARREREERKLRRHERRRALRGG